MRRGNEIVPAVMIPFSFLARTTGDEPAPSGLHALHLHRAVRDEALPRCFDGDCLRGIV